jgi:two-component system, NarL family, invasion response regulator UvrY
LCLLGSGKSVGQIAHELERSVKTISTYRARILEKMEMQSNAQLVHYVLQRRLAEPV